MKYQKINNPEVYLHNVDCIKEYNVIQKYKDVLLALSEQNIKLDKKAFKWIETEQEIIQVLNRYVDYYTAEGLLEKDTKTNKIKSVKNVNQIIKLQ